MSTAGSVAGLFGSWSAVPLRVNGIGSLSFTVKDLKAQNYSIEEAEEMLMRIEGLLDEKDIKQLRYGYENDSFELSFRPFETVDD